VDYYKKKGNLVVASYLAARADKVETNDSPRRVIISTLKRLAKVSCDFAKRGKNKEASELNKIIRKHMSKLQEQK